MPSEETGPFYEVELIKSLPAGGGMTQAMPSRKDLQEVIGVNDRVVAGYEVAIATLQERDKEIQSLTERLAKAEGVVEKLPETADGVPVCPGDSGLYGTDADGQIVEHCIAPHYHMTEGGEYEAWHIEEAGGELHDRMYASHESYPDETWYGNVQFLYSTREAAEAALAARSEGGE